MRHRSIAIFLLLCGVGCLQPGFAQPPDTLWTRTYMQSSGATDIHVLPDGGFIVGGGQGSAPRQGYLMRLQANGDTLWTRGLVDSSVTYNRRLMIAENGDYMFVGSGHSATIGGSIPTVGRMNPQGEMIWLRHYPDPDTLISVFDMAGAICQAHDGGYVIGSMYTGRSDNQGVCVIKIDEDGNADWRTYQGGNGRDHIWDLIPVEDGYVGTGHRQADVGLSTYIPLMKFGVNGDSIWTRTFSESWESFGWGLAQLEDGGYVIAGYVRLDNGNSADIAVIRTDVEGQLVWERYFGGTRWDEAMSVIVDMDGTILICGETSSTVGQDFQPFVMGISSEGDSLWTGYYGSLENDNANSIKQLSASEYVLCGGRNIMNWGYTFVARLANRDFAGKPPILLPNHITLYQNYPNPFNPSTTISFSLPHSQHTTISVYDLTGRLVNTLADEVMNAGEHSVTFNASGLPSGIYFARMTAGSQMQTQKMVLLK